MRICSFIAVGMLGIATSLLVNKTVPCYGQASFQGLGGLSHGSYAYGISGDGSTVVGSTYGDVDHAFKWTSDTGMVLLPPASAILDPNHAEAYAVSGDGSVVGGKAITGEIDLGSPRGTVSVYEATLWSGSSVGPIGFLSVGGLYNSVVTGISGDGTIAVGNSNWQSNGQSLQEAFRQDQDGMVGLGDLPGGGVSISATAISADGTTIIGTGAGDLGGEGFYWTHDTGMVSLGYGRIPTGVNADGTVIVGHYHNAFRWAAATDTAEPIPGMTQAADVSADGNVIVGNYLGIAKIWDPFHGTRSITALLTDFGIDLTGWYLGDPVAVSDDGTRIIGTGISPDGDTEAWLAVIPQINDGDYNNDGTVDAADYVVWRKNFGLNVSLPNETATIGIVTQEDFDVWRTGLAIPVTQLAAPAAWLHSPLSQSHEASI